MPAVDIDVENIPDIIEAQLTLSYSRLSDLIRVIVEQGNGHEDDIADLRQRLDNLTRENAELRDEVTSLKAAIPKGEDASSMEAKLRELQQTVADHSAAQEAERAKQQSTHEAHEATQKELQEAMRANTEGVAAAERAVMAALTRLATVERDLSLPKAFTDLWAARPELVFAMASRQEANPDEFEHAAEERAKFLHTLPAFAAVHSELEVLSAMLRRQSAEAIHTAARTSRSNSAVAVGNGGRSGEVDQLTEAVRLLEQRLAAAESQAGADRSGGESRKAPGGGHDHTKLEGDLAALQGRLASLEERLALLFTRATEGGDVSGGGVDSALPSAALADLALRMRSLEQVVEGSRAGAISSPTATAMPSGPAEQDHARDGGEVSHGRVGGILSSQQLAEVAGKDGAGSAGELGWSATLSPRPPSARSTSLPPLATPTAAGSPPGLAPHIPQPTLEALRRGQELASRGGAGAPASASRRISAAVEQDDGLRRRVAQLEENVAILEVNKADRRELQLLEEALRSLQQQPQYQRVGGRVSVDVSGCSGGRPFTPHRPVSGPTGGSFAYPHDEAGAGSGGSSRPQTSPLGYAGRPLFVGGGSAVNLRDGARLTSATISPSPTLP